MSQCLVVSINEPQLQVFRYPNLFFEGDDFNVVELHLPKVFCKLWVFELLMKWFVCELILFDVTHVQRKHVAVFFVYCSSGKDCVVDGKIFVEGQSAETICSCVLLPGNVFNLHSKFFLKLSQRSFHMSVRLLGCVEGEVLVIGMHCDVTSVNDCH
jgi:hypothetical protein